MKGRQEAAAARAAEKTAAAAAEDAAPAQVVRGLLQGCRLLNGLRHAPLKTSCEGLYALSSCFRAHPCIPVGAA